MPFGAQIVGLPELQADLAAWIATVPGELADANDAIGPRAVGRAYPTPINVGTGPGATPVPRTEGRVLVISAGGPWRADHQPEAGWGQTPLPRTAERPYLLRALEDDLFEIENEYLHAVLEAAAKIGWPPTQIRAL